VLDSTELFHCRGTPSGRTS